MHWVCPVPSIKSGCWVSDMKITSICCSLIGNEYQLIWYSFALNFPNWMVTVSPSSQKSPIDAASLIKRYYQKRTYKRIPYSYHNIIPKVQKNSIKGANNTNKFELSTVNFCTDLDNTYWWEELKLLHWPHELLNRIHHEQLG